MSFHFSKSKFVSACVHCNKYAWLDKFKPEEKSPVDAFTQSLFDNGHKVGALAQQYLHADVDVTAYGAEGQLDLTEMIRQTEHHLKLGTASIAEASFSYEGLFCSVDVLLRNDDGSYDLCEVKSSKREKPTRKHPHGVKEKYLLDAAYQRFVLEKCGLSIHKVYVVLLDRDYIRGDSLELDQYFVRCDVTAETAAAQAFVADKLDCLAPVLTDPQEPASVICKNCNNCDYFAYCCKDISTPSVFDIYGLDFPVKCQYYNDGVAFEDVPKRHKKLSKVAQLQIAYHRRPDLHVNQAGVRQFLDSLVYPLYSLDFETYQSVVPEHRDMGTFEQVPFQYSVHRIESSITFRTQAGGFLDLSGGDPRRAVAEHLVEDIPFGAHVVAYNHSTEANIVKRLAARFPDLAPHLLSFTYHDPLEVFRNGDYYLGTMGSSLSLKSVAPALYPDDPDMNYHNLEGEIKNGTQAMNAILRLEALTPSEKEKLRRDLETYCALDTLAVVKILQEFYHIVK